MTPFPYSVEAHEPLEEAERMMDEHDFHHLPVTRDGSLVGVLSRGHLHLARGMDAGVPGRLVESCYSPDPYVVDIGTPLDAVVTEMAARHLDSALVERKGKLVGILTHSDLARALGRLLRDLGPEEPPDEIG